MARPSEQRAIESASLCSRPRFRWKQIQHEIVNSLGVEESLVKFLTSRLKKTLFIRITVGYRIGRQSVGGILVLLERLINATGPLDDFAEIADPFEWASVKYQKPLQAFFSGLLAVVNGGIQMPVRQAANLLGGMQIVVRLDQPGAAQFRCRPSHRVFAPAQKSCAKGSCSDACSGRIQTAC